MKQAFSKFSIKQGWLQSCNHKPSPFFSPRPSKVPITLLVIHNISLPPKQFGGPYIDDLFLGKLNPLDHPSFDEIKHLKVSAHCLIRRNGNVTQYVSFDDMAWHAGVSNFQGKEKCNDFSIGIELEGCDDIPYETIQYQQLINITLAIQAQYPEIALTNIVGHCDIAPIRKTDPGEAFNWQYFRQALESSIEK